MMVTGDKVTVFDLHQRRLFVAAAWVGQVAAGVEMTVAGRIEHVDYGVGRLRLVQGAQRGMGLCWIKLGAATSGRSAQRWCAP